MRSALVMRSAPRGWLNFFDEKKEKNEKIEPATYPWASSVSVINPANTYYEFVFYFHIRLPAQTQSDIAGSIFVFFFIFSFKKLSQLDAIELDRCVWASAVLLR